MHYYRDIGCHSAVVGPLENASANLASGIGYPDWGLSIVSLSFVLWNGSRPLEFIINRHSTGQCYKTSPITRINAVCGDYILTIMWDRVSERRDAEFCCTGSRPMCWIFPDGCLKNSSFSQADSTSRELRSSLFFVCVIYFMALQYVRVTILVFSWRAEVNHEMTVSRFQLKIFRIEV
jgi:hypothetical protein